LILYHYHIWTFCRLQIDNLAKETAENPNDKLLHDLRALEKKMGLVLTLVRIPAFSPRSVGYHIHHLSQLLLFLYARFQPFLNYPISGLFIVAHRKNSSKRQYGQ
jgi:hypothetical protein